MKYLMDKVYGLSHKGISHLMQLDKANEELASLREQLAKERQLRNELVEWIEGHVDLEELADPKRIELLVQKAKNLSA